MPSEVGGWREQYQVGAGSAAPSLWLMLTLACLSWPAMAGPSLGGSSIGSRPQLDSALHACRDQLATYLLIIHYPYKKNRMYSKFDLSGN